MRSAQAPKVESHAIHMARAHEIMALQRQVKSQDKFILWQAERIVELEHRLQRRGE